MGSSSYPASGFLRAKRFLKNGKQINRHGLPDTMYVRVGFKKMSSDRIMSSPNPDEFQKSMP
jgi:hypothetical protein